MTDIKLTRDYPHPPHKVWRALTDPELIALWGMRPEGFSTALGTRFRVHGKANPGWRGFVECELLEATAPERLRYTWVDNEKSKATEVRFSLEPLSLGAHTRLTFEHLGFEGAFGFFFAKLMMTPGWKKMLDRTFSAVLRDVDAEGKLVASSKLMPLF